MKRGASCYSKKTRQLNIKSSSWSLSSIAVLASASLASLALVAILLPDRFSSLRPTELLFPYAADNGSVFAKLNMALKHFTTRSESCNFWHGEWVPDSSPPLYTNVTCPYISLKQNCLQNGRPDRGYLHWKWKPFACQLPRFNASFFLNLLRGKKLIFIGDSLARNHMESLLCSLTQVEDPLNLVFEFHQRKWLFSKHNFTLTHVWAPFLVNYTAEPEGQDIVYTLRLDVPLVRWVEQLAEYDVAIVSTGYWFHRPKCLYYINDKLVGATPAAGRNVTTMEALSVIRIVLANVFKHLMAEFHGITVLRTVTVDHFENGGWYDGGLCNRTSPFLPQVGIPAMAWMNSEINKLQVEEFAKAMANAKDASKLKLLNVTYSAHLRPDGHPGQYRVGETTDPPNDCLHWCMPGPIDMWNQLVSHTLQEYF